MKTGTSDYFSISGVRLRILIVNAHRLLRRKYTATPLWAMVSDLTGHGATVSAEICRHCGLEPSQTCGVATLATLP